MESVTLAGNLLKLNEIYEMTMASTKYNVFIVKVVEIYTTYTYTPKGQTIDLKGVRVECLYGAVRPLLFWFSALNSNAIVMTEADIVTHMISFRHIT